MSKEYSYLSEDELGSAADDAYDYINKSPDKKQITADTAKSFYKGSQAGGIGSGMMNAGVGLGIGSMGAAEGTALAAAGPVGWGLAAGGLGLSLIEAQNKSNQEAEEARVRQEEEKKKTQLIAINQAIQAAQGLS